MKTFYRVEVSNGHVHAFTVRTTNPQFAENKLFEKWFTTIDGALQSALNSLTPITDKKIEKEVASYREIWLADQQKRLEDMAVLNAHILGKGSL